MPKEASEGRVNPYQSPFPDDFRDEQTKPYEAAIETLEGTITELRDQIRELEAVNWGLIQQLMGMPVVFGANMESADVD